MSLKTQISYFGRDREGGEMEDSQNFGHQHPLLLLNEEQTSNGGEKAECYRCGEKVSAPFLSCAEHCGFYLHKVCAEAPSEINHPLHRDHPLVLLQNPPSFYTRCVCDFCDETCEKFIYHCSCELDFHIKCALFTYNIAQKNLKALEHVSLEDPLISSENDTEKNDGEEHEDLSMCFGCWEPLANYTYFSLECGFNLHKKCAELPLKMNHMCHRKHPLVLQFNGERLSCKICQVTRRRGFVYGCSACKFVVHIECSSPPPVIEDKSHQHPFSLILREGPFICDACGSEGSYIAYVCCACNIIIHKKCISLPHIIKSRWHDHHVFHTYFLYNEDFRSLDCMICHDEVNTEHGSYYCADCNIIFHVNCATKKKDWYYIVSPENEDEKSLDISSITNVLEWNNAGEATLIEHFKHIHYLKLSDKIKEYDDKCCDGCMLPITASFYYCLECDFFLHKACAELPQMKRVWHHACQLSSLVLTSDCFFKCELCDYLSNGFAYKCNECESHMCLRCVTLAPGTLTYPGHEHPLLFYVEYEGKCSACGDKLGSFCCKDCNFALDPLCITLPSTTQHKCDEHLLKLAYHEDNDYSEYLYCDICEERRDPSLWFYHCATCDTCAHVNCVLGSYPFIKLGSIYKEGDHPHPLTFVKKIYYYPECIECGEPCQDLALECAEPGCNYIVHWKCINPYSSDSSFTFGEI